MGVHTAHGATRGQQNAEELQDPQLLSDAEDDVEDDFDEEDVEAEVRRGRDRTCSGFEWVPEA